MDYSLQAYLQRLPTEKLEAFLEEYLQGEQKEDFSSVIGAVANELARRKKEEPPVI